MGGLYGRLGMAPWEGVLGLWNICSGTIGIHLAPVPSCVVLDTPQVMTSLASLLASSAQDIPLEGVRGLVDQGLPEGLILDYKEAYHPHIVETVVAMANTYGGLILVGVTDSPPRQLLGVEETVATSIANVCHDSLEPPWVPEIIPLPIDEKGTCLIVVRIDPKRAPRPVLYKGRALVRLHDRVATADRGRLAQLFQRGSRLSPRHRSRHHPPSNRSGCRWEPER